MKKANTAKPSGVFLASVTSAASSLMWTIWNWNTTAKDSDFHPQTSHGELAKSFSEQDLRIAEFWSETHAPHAVPPTSMGYFSPSMLCSEPGLRICCSVRAPQWKWNSTALYFLSRPPPPIFGDLSSATLTGGKAWIVLQEKSRSYINRMWEQRCSWDSNLSSSSRLAFQTECSRNSALQKLNSYKIMAEFNLRLILTIVTSGVRASYTSQKTLYSFSLFLKLSK